MKSLNKPLYNIMKLVIMNISSFPIYKSEGFMRRETCSQQTWIYFEKFWNVKSTTSDNFFGSFQ